MGSALSGIEWRLLFFSICHRWQVPRQADCPRRTLSSWEMKSFLIVLTLAGAAMAQPARWTEKTANEWYAKQPWLVGSNYLPSTAINQLEMWGTDTFDPIWIDTALNWAEGLGMN